MTTSILEERIKQVYQGFFEKMGINSRTGISKYVSKYGRLKFGTYPFIGSKYGQKPPILFVGLDLGKDESRNKILGFNIKRKVVEGMNDCLTSMNPQISGLYTSAIFFLERKHWKEIGNEISNKAGVRKFLNLRRINLLCYVALTNLFKYVTEGRTNRTGGNDRRHFSEEQELQLLLNEIRILNPHIIVLQSRHFLHKKYTKFLEKLKNQNKRRKIYVIPHPASRYRGSRSPEKYICQLQKL